MTTSSRSASLYQYQPSLVGGFLVHDGGVRFDCRCHFLFMWDQRPLRLRQIAGEARVQRSIRNLQRPRSLPLPFAVLRVLDDRLRADSHQTRVDDGARVIRPKRALVGPCSSQVRDTSTSRSGRVCPLSRAFSVEPSVRCPECIEEMHHRTSVMEIHSPRALVLFSLVLHPSPRRAGFPLPEH